MGNLQSTIAIRMMVRIQNENVIKKSSAKKYLEMCMDECQDGMAMKNV